MHEDSVLIGPRIARTGPASLYPMIAAQSQLRPDAIAISYGARVISYAQLGQQSALIRDALLAAGSTPGQLIPILTRGGPGMIAAMLGVWAAGAAFAPLAMDGPEARRDLALSRIGAGIAVVDNIADAPDGWTCISIAQTLDAEQDRIPATVDSTDICPGDSLAYGFFTSGSTGIPKCCLNIHSGLVNRAATMSRRFNLRPGEAVLQNSSHVFDSSLWQIFWPLSVGAEVAIPERYSILDFEATLNTIAARRVVMTDFVPTILEQLITTLRNSAPLLSKLASLRYILVGGEQLNAHLLRDLLQLLPAVQIVNTYGPTEASIGMVFHAFTGKEAAVPLGLPIDNTALAVVDENLRPVPRGRIGEIVIGGACMGIGYLGDPERTEAVFQRGTGLPLGSDVVYRTGDLGRIEADGLLYFDGRADDQIKIAGVRIELGEIEHHLYDYPHVLKAKVIPVKNDGQTWLAGFYSASEPISQQDLRAHLERKLGKSSVPSMLRQLESFPLTVSGKIDGKALIATHCTFEAGSPDANASGDTLPDQLIQAVQRALPGHQPKLDDDLILAGLDSLGALKLLLEAERITGKNIPLPAFLTRPTITTLLSGENDSAYPADDRDEGTGHDEATLIENDIRRLGQLSGPSATTQREAPGAGTIVLTGATGYVGRALLTALLRDGATSIVCPVRAADDQAATARLAALIPDLPADRVRVLALDLCADDAIRRLPSAPRIVVHAAADVNFSKTYRQLRETNVHSTAALCAYALEHGARFHYVSSVVAFAGQDAGPLSQRSSADIRHALSRLGNGYSRTKWASEQIISAFQERGLEAEAYRLGEMMPDALYPIANPLATFTILCRVARLTGVVPELAEVSNCTPTGLAAQWIAHRCLADDDANPTSNVDTQRRKLGTLLAHPTEVPVDAMGDAVLGKMPCVSLSKFRDIVGRRYGETQHPDLARCLMIFSSVNRPEDEKYLFERSAVSRPSTPSTPSTHPAPAHRDRHEAAPAWSTMTSKDLDDMFDVFRQSVLSH